MSKRKKYAYNKDLKIFSYLNPPVLLPMLPVMQFFMKSFYYTDLPDKNLTREKINIPLRNGGEISALIYTPKNIEEKNTPCIVFYHGGGFVYNAAPHHFTLAKKLAVNLGVKVIFPDYHLAPAHPFPAAVEDAYDTYIYVKENSVRLGIDKNRIALCGDSAGGNLSAVVCLMAKENRISMPCAQVLLYPFVDSDSETESMRAFTDTPMCNSKAAVKYNKAYIPQGTGIRKEWFSAVDADDHSGLPQAYIETAEFDCLHDGGVKYYNKLIESGNKAVLFETKGTMHGYDIATKSDVYALCMKKRTEFLKGVFDENKSSK